MPVAWQLRSRTGATRGLRVGCACSAPKARPQRPTARAPAPRAQKTCGHRKLDRPRRHGRLRVSSQERRRGGQAPGHCRRQDARRWWCFTASIHRAQRDVAPKFARARVVQPCPSPFQACTPLCVLQVTPRLHNPPKHLHTRPAASSQPFKALAHTPPHAGLGCTRAPTPLRRGSPGMPGPSPPTSSAQHTACAHPPRPPRRPLD